MWVQQLVETVTFLPATLSAVALVASMTTFCVPFESVRSLPGTTGSYSAARGDGFSQNPTVAPIALGQIAGIVVYAIEFVSPR